VNVNNPAVEHRLGAVPKLGAVPGIEIVELGEVVEDIPYNPAVEMQDAATAAECSTVEQCKVAEVQSCMLTHKDQDKKYHMDLHWLPQVQQDLEKVHREEAKVVHKEKESLVHKLKTFAIHRRIHIQVAMVQWSGIHKVKFVHIDMGSACKPG